jgi:hypothetical protein
LKDLEGGEVLMEPGNIVVTELSNRNRLAQVGLTWSDLEVNENDIGKFEAVIRIVLLIPQPEQL